jgi:hypothetical protein
MALNKDTLGQALYDAEKVFNDKNPATLGNLETARLNFWKYMADEIIKHFKANAVISVNVVTTGTATNHTGTGTGNISA